MKVVEILQWLGEIFFFLGLLILIGAVLVVVGIKTFLVFSFLLNNPCLILIIGVVLVIIGNAILCIIKRRKK